jgi:hypothetical protein
MDQFKSLSNPNNRGSWLSLPTNQVRLARILSFILAGTWLLFGIVFLIRSQGDMPLPPGWSIVIGPLMLGNAAAFAWAGFGLGMRRRVYFNFALLLVAANLLLTLTDEVGLFDLITLGLLLIFLILLLHSRKAYPGREPPA